MNLTLQINQLTLLELICQFLYDQKYPDSHVTGADVSLDVCPHFTRMISVFASAAATYYAPSDPSSLCGMHCEHIQATPSWQ